MSIETTTPEMALANIEADYQAVQDHISASAAEGTLTLQEARVGKMLSQTGSEKMFETLQKAEVSTLDIPEHDNSDALSRIEARLSAGAQALSREGITPPASEYRHELDHTGVSNEVYNLAVAQGGQEGQTLLQSRLHEELHNAGSENMPAGPTREQIVDTLARQVEAEIKEKPDWDEREYGALIYENENGEIKVTPLTRGQTVDEAENASDDAPGTRISVPSDLGSGKILGVVHNHPDEGYNNQQDRNNRNPSDNDWDMYDTITSNGMANRADLSLYVIDSKGQMREFNEADQSSHNGDNNPRTPDEQNDVDYVAGL